MRCARPSASLSGSGATSSASASAFADDGRVGGELLVSDLDERHAGRARRRHVAPPHPGGPACVARVLELLAPVGLDPEPRVRAVRQAGVVRPLLLTAEPRLLEKRADDVPAVADDVDDPRVGICDRHAAHEERHLRGLLDGPNRSDQADAPCHGEDSLQPGCRERGLECRQLRNRRLHRGDLAEVDEPRERADRACEERRARSAVTRERRRTDRRGDRSALRATRPAWVRASSPHGAGSPSIRGCRARRRFSQRRRAQLTPPAV